MAVHDLTAWERAGEPLRWTDDTHMTLAFAESLIECGGFDGDHLARTFAQRYREEPWRGYGAGPPQVFALLERGTGWREAGQRLFGGQGSFGNGAAMRVAPAGLLGRSDPTEAVRLARESALVTHAHELGRQGAALQARAVAFLADVPIGRLDTSGLMAALREAAPAPEYGRQLDALLAIRPEASAGEAATVLGHGISATEAVPAALHAFLRHPGSFVDAVRRAIMLGGDTDTIAAMAGALAGAFLGLSAVPATWRNRLEDADRILAVADGLHRLAESVVDPERP